MTCEGCINTHKCYDCQGQNMYLREVKRGEHKPSAWEKRWIRWVKKNER